MCWTFHLVGSCRVCVRASRQNRERFADSPALLVPPISNKVLVAANDALAPTTLAVAASMDARAVESSVGSRRATSIDRAASAKRDLAARTSMAASPAS